ncbi:MAG: hypothetical protein KJ941_07570 [Bacteroidetes bacterium]|nr:hypothetical protein [Bacteroidota bacterium]
MKTYATPEDFKKALLIANGQEKINAWADVMRIAGSIFRIEYYGSTYTMKHPFVEGEDYDYVKFRGTYRGQPTNEVIAFNYVCPAREGNVFIRKFQFLKFTN